jgi:hypothetical protein
MKRTPLAHAISLACLLAASATHAATGLVTFDPPGTPQGPSIYVAVPAMQTIVAPEATFSGGVVLGLATNFPAIQYATGPNVYGTADFGNGLSNLLRIDVTPGFAATEVSFALFNGETFLQTYQVNAFNGSSLVASQTIAYILPNYNSGFALADVASAAGITSVTINAVNPPGAFDFLIDTVAFNQSITTVVPNAPPPPVYIPSVTPPVTIPPVTVTYTEPDTIDAHGHKQKGKTVQVVNQVINFGDDVNNAKGHFETLTSPVPETSTTAMLLAGLAAMGLGTVRRQRRANAG